MSTELDTRTGMPQFYVDAHAGKERAWISAAWRGTEDLAHPAAALALLRHPNFTAEHAFSIDDAEQAELWKNFRAYCVALDSGPQSSLTAFGTGGPRWITAIGFSSARNAAVLTSDGWLLGNREDSSAVMKLRDFLAGWEDAKRPGPEVFTAQLEQHTAGWSVVATV
ncbi:hypothetical protein F4553_000199 [Allocatelliglobosispora scoriae]|uniref:Uncharacterized protein n=1 Tax=Allocatelliglobosispora scoriae TaxID=643052 RepID=A0A841BJ25_9ACTN|nr:hypothetical protein [Allocatelliglobosispora scoriae]MBB5866820.1 hypothetical protein [Allocatelliglobosispora scoriae]